MTEIDGAAQGVGAGDEKASERRERAMAEAALTLAEIGASTPRCRHECHLIVFVRQKRCSPLAKASRRQKTILKRCCPFGRSMRSRLPSRPSSSPEDGSSKRWSRLCNEGSTRWCVRRPLPQHSR